ncbi:MAG: CorA family divalent cation transporter [bacterium]|nr:CorA family divalent cation transporter [bacterium]
MRAYSFDPSVQALCYTKSKVKIIKRKLAWIDVLNPTKKDLEFIRRQHRFHPIILDELLHVSARARVEPYHDYLFLTYHLPIYDKAIKNSRRAEIDFLITKNKVITVHYEDLEPLNTFWRKLSNDERFKKRVLDENTGRIVYHVIQEILEFSQRQIRHIEDTASYLSGELFKKHEAQLLQKISWAKRDILDYNIISKPQSIILESLKEVGERFWGASMKIYLSDLVGDHLKIMQRLDNFKETVEALEQTNAQLLNAKTNSVMQRFTVLAFLTFPLILIISLFNVVSIDRLIGSNPVIFAVSFFAILIITLLLLLLFRKKEWL